MHALILMKYKKARASMWKTKWRRVVSTVFPDEVVFVHNNGEQ